MTRILAVLLVAFLVLAPAAAAKGPHVIMTTGPEAVEPGTPWEATLEFNEFRHVRRPVMTASRGDRRVTARIASVPASMEGATGFKTRMVFPTAEERDRVVKEYGADRGAVETLDRLGEHLARM